MFTAEATGTEPLSYQWQWKPVMECRKWKPCDVDKFVGADSSLVTIPRVQKSNEGSYRCIITNCAGNQTSNPANLTVGKDPTIRTKLWSACMHTPTTCVLFLHIAEPPQISSHPQELIDNVQGKAVNFTIQATGTEPLTYHWQWKPAEGIQKWQSCPAEWSDGTTLTIPMVENSSEGSYRCVVSNCAGTQTSHLAVLKVSWSATIWDTRSFVACCCINIL